jgi:transcriptional regulator with XRE-family HTH domain
MYLPGTVNDRIGDLRVNKGLNQKELSELIGVAPSQMSRIESGETKNISSDILIKLAKVFGVSTDYILGLTAISSPKNYDVGELGLSEGAVRAILTGKADIQVLNRLLEHQKFRELLRLIKTYFTNSLSAGIMGRNEILNLATSMLGDYAKENPEHKAEAQEDIRFIKSSMLGENEAEIEKIKNIFMSILKDIKKDIYESIVPGQAAGLEYMRQVMAEVQGQNPKTPEEVSEIVANMVKKAANLDDDSAEMFMQSIMQIITHIGEQE